MSAAPTIRDRVRQMRAWLEHEFPTPYPVRVYWHRCTGDTWAHTSLHPKRDARHRRLPGGNFRIALDTSLLRQRGLMEEVLIHEWAHCLSWPIPEQHWVDQVPDHADEWGLSYAKVYRLFYDGGGRSHSNEFPWRKKR